MCPNLKLIKRKFILGKNLKIDETSSSGLYAICSKRKNKVLRMTVDIQMANLLLDESREVKEVWLI